VEIESDKGHDAFLLDEPELFSTVRGFLNSAASRRGLPGDGA
jgi:homoserine O-acetyltransferase